jgi:zinc protease
MRARRLLLRGFVLVGAVLAGNAPCCAPAQEAAEKPAISWKKVEHLNEAPVSNAPLPVHLPLPYETRLANGLRVLVVEDHRLPVVTFGLWLQTGSLADPPEAVGLARATAEMLAAGTLHADGERFTATLYALGGSWSAGAEPVSDSSTVFVSGLTANAEPLLALMADAVRSPMFPVNELSVYKRQRWARTSAERASAAGMAREKLYQVLYGDSPAARFYPSARSITNIVSSRLQAFHDQHYTPGNAILGAVGDVKRETTLAMIRKYFGNWSGPAATHSASKPLPPPAPLKVYLLDKPEASRAFLLAGGYGVRRTDPDLLPLSVMLRVLAGAPASRLTASLPETPDEVSQAEASVNAQSYPGPWQVSAEVPARLTADALAEVMKQLRRVRDEKVSAEELNAARRSLVAQFALSTQRPAAVLGSYLFARSVGWPGDYWNRYPGFLGQVTPDDVQRVAQKYIDLSHLPIVCVADAKQVKSALEKVGPVEEYDASGRRVP